MILYGPATVKQQGRRAKSITHSGWLTLQIGGSLRLNGHALLSYYRPGSSDLLSQKEETREQ
jgi:hypothetical protein